MTSSFVLQYPDSHMLSMIPARGSVRGTILMSLGPEAATVTLSRSYIFMGAYAFFLHIITRGTLSCLSGTRRSVSGPRRRTMAHIHHVAVVATIQEEKPILSRPRGSRSFCSTYW